MPYGVVLVGPYECVPLVTRESENTVDVRVHFYRREEPAPLSTRV
jgi:hypothetical protein